MEGLVPLLPMVGILLVFWLLVIRPGARRERERRAMQDALSVGDEIILTSGFFGTIRSIDDDRADIDLAPGVTVTVALGAVGGLATPPTAGPDLSKTTTDADASTTPESEEK